MRHVVLKLEFPEMATEDELAEGSADSDSSPSGETAVAEPQEFKLSIDVAIEDIGPCKKHVRITIPRADITHIYGMEVGDLISSADVPGFRLGHAPKQLIEKRYRSELDGKVKQRLLLDSLEQLADEDRLDPINQPNIDVDDIEIPAEGDFEYEFDVEVRPDFALPEYKELRLRRPVKEITESDVQEFLDRYLAQYGELEECEGTAELNDFVTLSVEFTHEERLLRKLSDLTVQVKPSLRFTDAEVALT